MPEVNQPVLTRRRFLAAAGAGVLAAPLARALPAAAQTSATGFNLLHIVLDDANDWFPFLGPEDPLIGRLVAHAPNLSALAEESLNFQRAYAAVPQCAGSRVATLIGLSPERTGLEYDQVLHAPGGRRCDTVTGTGCYGTWFGSGLGLAGDLAAAGYRQFGAGKIAHVGTSATYRAIPQLQDLSRWHTAEGWLEVRARYGRRIRRVPPGLSGMPAGTWYPSGPSIDRVVADSLISQWPERAPQPWHMVAGFIGTHTPFVNRQQWRRFYEDVADPSPIAAALADRADIPIIGRPGPDYQSLSTEDRMGIVRAYLASLSEADAQVGRLLDQLVRTKEVDTTVIVVWTDHGYFLGQKLQWGKTRLQEQALRVPLLIRVPGQAGRSVDTPVSLLDLRATLTAILGVPTVGISDSVSLLDLLDAPPEVAAEHEVVSYWSGGRSYRRGSEHRIEYPDGSEERYDLAVDPGELVNLAASGR